MVKHIQKICRLLPTTFLIVFDHFVGLALKGLIQMEIPSYFCSRRVGLLLWENTVTFYMDYFPRVLVFSNFRIYDESKKSCPVS